MLRNFALSFVATFVALDVVGILPMYISLTSSLNRQTRRSVVNKSMVVAFFTALAFMFCGQALFRALGIDLWDFKIAGGLVLLLVSLADLIGGPEKTREASGETGIVPLAVPLITGPVVLTSVVIQANTFGFLVTFLSLLANYILAWALFRRSDLVTALIGKDGTVVVSKIAALLMTAISVAMIRSGVFEAIKAYGGGH